MNTELKTHPLVASRDRLDRTLVGHTRFRDVMEKIMAHILFPTDTKIIWVIGPTGVGKSRLAEFIQNRLLKEELLAARITSDPSCVPSVRFEVPCVSSNHQFAWKPFCYLYLDQLRAPLIPSDRKLAELPDADGSRGPEYLVLNAFEYRRPIVALLDEANHFANVASGKVLLEQMTRIKSFVNRTNVLHVLFGTYELAPLIRLSGQLARRCEVIHFGRYRAEFQDELKVFAEVVRRFQDAIPVAHNFDLQTRLKFLHERSLGCVGTLKTWLVRALSHAHMKKRNAIEYVDLQATALGVDNLTTMLNEAIVGESKMAEPKQADLDIFLEQLGHKQKRKGGEETQQDLFGDVVKPTPSGKKAKPFEPLPYRHLTGAGRNGNADEMVG